jgi:hypothetical protein
MEVELTLVRVESDYEREHWEISLEEKEALIPTLKAQGDAMFKTNDVPHAAEKYFVALAYIEALKARDGNYPAYLSSTRIALLLNLSACKLKTKDYQAVIEHTSSVLELDASNTKALCRRGQAHLERCVPTPLTLSLETFIRSEQILASQDTDSSESPSLPSLVPS